MHLSLSFIIGYAGYIPSVASENVYGVTYSKATQSSAESTIHKGMDQPSSIKFRSTANAEFQQRHADNFESVSQTVGVRRQQDRYQAVSNGHENFRAIESRGNCEKFKYGSVTLV